MSRWMMLALAVVALGASPAAAQERFAWVNVDYVVANSTAFKNVQEQMAATQQMAQDSVQARNTAFSQNVQAALAAAENATQAQQDSINQSLEQQRQTVVAFQQQVEQQLQAQQQQLMQQVFDQVQTAIDAVAQRDGYTWVFANGGGSNNLLVAPDGANISDEVLRQLGDEPPAPPPGN